MRVTNIRARTEGSNHHVEADVAFENQARTETVGFSVPVQYADWIAPRPDAFLLGTAIAAQHLGERRVQVEGALDPQLVQRLQLGLRLLARWWEPAQQRELLAVESLAATVTPAASAEVADADKKVAVFLSGGVDSLSALIWNTQQYPLGHPERIGVAFLVYGLDVGDPNKAARSDVFELAAARLAALCERLSVTLVPITINLRNLCPNWRFYESRQFASLLASIAHVAGHRLRKAIIATDNQIEYVTRYGSHPWLNAYFSSDALQMSTGDTEQFSRLQRVQLFAQLPDARDALRVCFVMDKIPRGYLNCGTCPKCVRTLLELTAAQAPDFGAGTPVNVLTADMLKGTRIDQVDIADFYLELPEPLSVLKRNDLARAVSSKLRQFWLREYLGWNWLRPRLRTWLAS